MQRLAATFRCDARLQRRNGFYYAAAFVAFVWLLILAQLPADQVAWLMPVFVLSNLIINTFYFVAGQVLLEKGEGTLQAQVVTPLRRNEYLGSKIVTLTGLAILENLAIVVLGYGWPASPTLLLAGMCAASAMYVLTGFVLVSRYDSINAFLFPSFIFTLAFAPPILAYLGLWTSPLAYLHPLQAPLVLLAGAFAPPSPAEVLYGLAWSAAWIALLLAWAGRSFSRNIVGGQGRV